MEPLTAGIAAAAALGSAAFGGIQTGRMNKRAERFSREMWDKQGEREKQNWDMTNAYNDPSAQMQRLKTAGLNPNLVYGNGATTEANMVSPKQAAQPDFKVPSLDLTGVVHQALATQQAQANIARTKAETAAIESRTVGTEFQNSLNQSIGIDKMARNYDIATDKLEVSQQKELAEYNAWETGAFQGKATTDPSSPIAKAVKAGYDITLQKLKNEKSLGDLRGFETTIKQFEAGLAKQGISPNSPWYVKIVGDLITKVLGLSSLSSFTQNLTD